MATRDPHSPVSPLTSKQGPGLRRLHPRDIESLYAIAAGGGLGRATAITDCIAEGPDQLMYMEGDVLLLLRDSGDELLAYCEGEVGWVQRSNIAFDYPCASSSSEVSSTSSCEAASTTTTTIVPGDTRSTSSTPSNSVASAQPPFTPNSAYSIHSARSSQSTPKSWPSTPHDMLSGISDAHEPGINSSPYLVQETGRFPTSERNLPLNNIHEMDCNKRQLAADDLHQHRIPSPSLDIEDSFTSLSTDLNHTVTPIILPSSTPPARPSTHHTERIRPREAPPRRPSNQSLSGQASAPEPASSRCSSPSSSQSDYSDAGEDGEDGPGQGSDLPYAQAGPRRTDPSPTPNSAAMISLSALGVHNTFPAREEPISLGLVHRSTQDAQLPMPRNHLVRHVEHYAGSLAVPVEGQYRQSFAADIARLSEVPSEYMMGPGTSCEELASVDGDDRLSARPGSSLPRSPASRDLNLRPDGDYGNGLLPRMDDSDYPITPGTFGSGRTPNDTSSPAQFVKIPLPSANMTIVNKLPPIIVNEPALVVRRGPAFGSNQPVQVVELENTRPRPLRKPSSQTSIDSGSHEQSPSEETILATPQSAPVGAFSDGPAPLLGAGLDLDPMDNIELVQPDSSMTDPLPPQKQPEPVSAVVIKPQSSLSVGPDKNPGLSPINSPSLTPRPDSLASVDSRWSMESRAAAKSAMRGEFYALGHSPQLTESQQQTWRTWTSNVAVDTEQSTPAKSPPVPCVLVDSPPATSSDSRPQESIPPATPLFIPSGAAVSVVPSTRPTGTTENEARETSATSHSYRAPPPPPAQSGSPAHQRKLSGPTSTFAPNIPPRSGPSAPSLPPQQRRRPVGIVGHQNNLEQNPGIPPNQHKDPGSHVPDSTNAVTSPFPAAQLHNPPLVPYAIGAIVPTHQHVGNPLGPRAPNLIRRITSPTTSSFSDSQHVSHRTILPSELLMRQQHQPPRDVPTPPFGSSDDNHTYSDRGHGLHRSMLPNRTTSSNDGHYPVTQPTRLVTLPSEMFPGNRPSPNRSFNSDSSCRAHVPNLSEDGHTSVKSSSPIPSRAPSATVTPNKQASTTSSVSDHSEVLTSGPTLTRGRSRSFSAAIAKTLGKKTSRRGQPERPPLPYGSKEELIVGSISTVFGAPKPGFLRTVSNGSSISSEFGGKPSFESFDSHTSASRPWLAHTRSSSSISRSQFRPAVSHRDYADPTVNADGMEFEIIQPRKVIADTLLVRTSVDPSDSSALTTPSTMENSDLPPELDEWGFLKHKSPTPQIFRSRQSPAEVRAAEQKWLSAIAQPLSHGQSAPKKIRRMVIEQGVPPSLRGRVWEWFMSNGMNGRVGGLFGRLLSDEPGPFDEQIAHDVQAVYSDHSVFYRKDSPGQADLKTLLRAYVHFAPSGYRTDIARLAGALLIHAVLEDAFWLLAGLFNGVLKSYYVLDTQAFIVDLNVFSGILEGSEPRIGQLFRTLGVLPEHYLVKWWSGMFIRSLPWPTVLRLLDVVISEGPRYLMIASLAILTLSRDRLLQLPRNQTAVVDYLRHLPQDSLLLPETFMRACDQVKLRDVDLKKLRKSVKGQMAQR